MFDKVVHIKVKLRPTDGISKIKDNEIVYPIVVALLTKSWCFRRISNKYLKLVQFFISEFSPFSYW